MKKSLLALAALTAFTGVASAQSSVTLFGIVDVNVRSQKNGGAGTIISESTDGINSSRLGFRGVEDLGGGLRAGFWLEGALSPDNGTAGGQTWQRRSTVSLLGAFGEVRLGRDYTATFWNHTIFDVFGTNGVGSELNIWAKATPLAGTTVRANNMVGYFLPELGGFYGQLQVAAGEATTGNKYYGGRFGYSGGPLNVAAAYGKTDKTGAMTDSETEWNIGGSYNFGVASVMGLYADSEYADVKHKGWTLGVAVPIGAGTIQGTYGEIKRTATGYSGKTTQIAVGYQYDLSKRTALYAHYAQTDNDAGLAFLTSGSGPAVSASDIANGFKSTGYEFGIRHSF